MALKKTIDFHGLQIVDAYLRVDAISWSRGEPISCVVAVRRSAEDEQPITSYRVDGIDFSPVVEEGVVGTVYSALKLLPDFVDAEDA